MKRAQQLSFHQPPRGRKPSVDGNALEGAEDVGPKHDEIEGRVDRGGFGQRPERRPRGVKLVSIDVNILALPDNGRATDRDTGFRLTGSA
ncbi:hypothetical protein [Gemmatimonas sp.]|uniref:hypothetical protein n=1 Tax=Gemmatimonas sp. TaxID=1962908 RepID=UPI0035667ADC